MPPLIDLDHQLFFKINQVWISSVCDALMPYVTDFRNTWWILLIGCVIWIAAQKMRAVKIILACVVALSVSDGLNSRIIKPLVHRGRPQQELGVNSVRLLTFPHSGYGFASSHAANSFSVATMIVMAEPIAAFFVLPLALLIAFSRVYVGVHFPLDVFAGGLIGIFSAIVADNLISAIMKIVRPKKRQRPQ